MKSEANSDAGDKQTLMALRESASRFYTCVAAMPALFRTGSHVLAFDALQKNIERTENIGELLDRVKHRLEKTSPVIPIPFMEEATHRTACEGVVLLCFMLKTLSGVCDDKRDWLQHPFVAEFTALASLVEDEVNTALRELDHDSAIDIETPQPANDEISRQDLLATYEITSQALDYRIKNTGHPKPSRIEGRKQWFCTKSVDEWRAKEKNKT